MTPDDDYERWLSDRRDVRPPAGLADRIMASVESTESPGRPDLMAPAPSVRARVRIGPLLLCLAASLVFAVRIASLVGNLVFPTSGSHPEFAADQRIEKVRDEHSNSSRS